MKYKVNFAKRSLMLLLVAWITFTSVFFAYQESTECAEWIAGTIASIAGGPILTALVIGGVVVAGGVALYELSQTDLQDHKNFVDGIKTGFQGFVAEQEKQIALEQDQSLSDQQAADIGVSNARNYVNNFYDNAINTVKTTGSNLKSKAVEYWKLFCAITGDVADNGIIENNGDITSSTIIDVPFNNLTSLNFSFNNTSIGSNCSVFNNKYYIVSGEYPVLDGNNFVSTSYTTQETDTAFYIPYLQIQTYDHTGYVGYELCLLTIRKSNNSFLNSVSIFSTNISSSNVEDNVRIINNLASFCTFPIVIWQNSFNIMDLYNSGKLSVGASNSFVPDWKRSLDNTLSNTHIGQAIQTGRRQLVNSGDHIISVFQEDSVPVKKTGVEVNDGVVSAPVGWDIPAGNTWDDVFLGNKPFSDVVDDTGCVSVPSDDIIGSNPTDTVVDYPVSTDVQDSADYPKTDVDDPSWTDEKPQDTPDKPYQDILDDQSGSFYPAAMDISELFPFCIPFDIYYLVQKFTVQQGEAPVLTIPIVYPRAIQTAMGSDHYDVVIDFNDYITLRNIIRIFLLLLFIIGLMQITRNLIRG